MNKEHANNIRSRRRRLDTQVGMSLVSLMVGIAISSFLLLMVAQLSTIAKQNYQQTQNIIGLYDNAREAISFLKSNVAVAGFGITQPASIPNVVLSSANSAPSPGGYGVLPDWVYLGYYDDWGCQNCGDTCRDFNNKVIWNQVLTPTSCATAVNNTKPTSQFFGTQYCYQCVAPDAGFDKTRLAMNTNTNSSVCCASQVNSCPGSPCASPTYNCGGACQNAVYQKLMRHVCFSGESHPFYRCTWQGVNLGVANNVSGDTLGVVFSNPGPAKFTTFSGTSVAAAPTQPPSSFRYYVFFVDNTNSMLRAYDSSNGITYNIANNIEFMAVMAGESDKWVWSGIGNQSAGNLPNMSRYVRGSTADLYPYRISSIKVGIVVRSQDPLPLTATSAAMNVLQGTNGSWVTYTPPQDGRLRKVFTTTIFLNSYRLPDYQMHCANVGGNAYLKIGGIPFSASWTANDECYVKNQQNVMGSNCASMATATCETLRMQGGGP